MAAWARSPDWVAWAVTVLSEHIRSSGDRLPAEQVAALYTQEPNFWHVVRAFGSFKRFCLAQQSSLEWVDEGGSGSVQLRARPARRQAASRRTVPLASTFAGQLPELVSRPSLSRDALQELWQSFCAESGATSGGFSTVLYFLVTRWHVLERAGRSQFRLAGRTRADFRRRTPADHTGALAGERPPALMEPFVSAVADYPLPGDFRRLMALDVYTMQRSARDHLTDDLGLTPRSITEDNFKAYQHAVLFAEELQMTYDIALYDLEVTEPLTRSQSLHTIYVPGLAEKRPSVLRGDAVLLTCSQGRFKGYVHQVLLDRIEVSFHQSFRNRPPFKVHFTFCRTPLRTMHRAVDELAGSLVLSLGIPQPAAPQPHPGLNEEQAGFLAAVTHTHPSDRGQPLLLWGPPGTGKTTTLVHTILAVLAKYQLAKVLVTAPSNPAADLLCRKLAEGGVETSQMLRLVAVQRDVRHIDAAVMPFTRRDEAMGCFLVPQLAELKAQRVVVATCSASAYIRSRMAGLSDSWFTHVFVDEAAQALEAEALVPLTLRLERSGRIFLAGDFKQLGPVIRSPVAIEFGLGKPLMERIVETISTTHSRCFTLLNTYRAHASILKLYNGPVYAGVLRCCSPGGRRDLEGWPECPRDAEGRVHPVIFHHCNGQESRGQGSPSWQNEEEATIVRQYLRKLLAHGVGGSDIGIISPYHQQCQRLRGMSAQEDGAVQVGTTELFQGQEKRVIIISTVRSRQQDEVTSDFRFTLGFLGNYKRTNVAVSRAKSLLIIVGNFSLLTKDATWHNIARIGRQYRSFRGPPFELSTPVYGENSEWTGNSGGPVPAAADRPDGVADRPWRDPL